MFSHPCLYKVKADLLNFVYTFLKLFIFCNLFYFPVVAIDNIICLRTLLFSSLTFFCTFFKKKHFILCIIRYWHYMYIFYIAPACFSIFVFWKNPRWNCTWVYQNPTKLLLIIKCYLTLNFVGFYFGYKKTYRKL